MHDLETLLGELERQNAVELLLATGQRVALRRRDGEVVSLTTRPLTPGELRDIISGTALTAAVRAATTAGIEMWVEVEGRPLRVRAVRAGVAVSLRLFVGRRGPRSRVVLPTPAPLRAAEAHERARSTRAAEAHAPRPATGLAAASPAGPPPGQPAGQSTGRPAPTPPRPRDPPASPRPEAPEARTPRPQDAEEPPPAQPPPSPSPRAAAAPPSPPVSSPTPPRAAAEGAERWADAGTLTARTAAGDAGDAETSALPLALLGLLEAAREVGASDLHVVPGAPPQVRTPDGLSPLAAPVPPKALDALALELAGSAETSRVFPSEHVRITALPAVDGVSLHVRLYPRHRPTPDDLGLALVAERLADTQRGLILVGSRRGHGRGTTRDTLVEHLARAHGRAAVSLAPVAPPYEDGRARWWPSLDPADAVHQAVAQAVEVLAFPDLVSPAWVAAAQEAVEAGCVVVATVPCRAGGEVITRVVDLAPRPTPFTAFLAGELRLALFQHLLPPAAGAERVPALELLWGGVRLWSTLRAAAEQEAPPALGALLERGAVGDARSLRAAVEELALAGRVNEGEVRRVQALAVPPVTALETRGQTAQGAAPPGGAAPSGRVAASGARAGGLGGRLGSLFRSKEGRTGAKG